MKHKSLFIGLLAVLIIVLLAVWIKIQTSDTDVPQPKPAMEIFDTDIGIISPDSIILGTDKDVYSPEDNITAYVLVKNEFDSEKDWELVVGIKPADPDNADFIAYQTQKAILAPGEIKRQDIEIDKGRKKLAAGEYRLELSVRENNQGISLKSIAFEVR